MRRMGNLRNYMPITYLTFLAGWLAICGIIPFSGFWSKDEILWNAASTRHIPVGWIVWLVGTIAATCTAFYMTRLVAMTFWGKERFLEPHTASEHEAHGHGGHGGHGHGVHIPHESPRSMTIPLIVLAILATIGGLVGIGPAFRWVGWGEHPGGRVNISNWMDPVIWNPVTHEFGKHATSEHGPAQEETSEAAVPTEHAAAANGPYGNVHSTVAQSVEHTVHSELATEWIFVVISLIAAGIGIGLGFLFYVKDTRLPDIWAQRLRPLYTASYNKYWVDEFYGWAITRRTMDAARAVYAFDSKVVDGAVNGLASLSRLFSRITGGIDKYLVDGLVNTIAAFIIRLMSPLFRAAQTGFTQNYALVMVLGLMLAVALLFWPDISARFIK